MPETLIYFNDKFLKETEAPELILDRGLFFGDGVFESLKAVRGKILGLKDHLQRLLEGIKVLKMEPSWDETELENSVQKIVKESDFEECYIRITITRGKWLGSIPPIVSSKPNLIILCRKFLPFREELYERGFRTVTLPMRRNESSPLSRIKSLNYLDNILGRMLALEKGLDEGIFLNIQGFLTEGTASNLFLVRGQSLTTPPIEDGVLPGITRKIVLEQASSLGLKTEARSIKPEEILSSNEAFLTNSLMGIVPWVQSDGKEIQNGRPGTITRKIRALYQNLI
jgi:branched-subunit amino acid aminotransferase/4-amino-4-deoxychorismate lyase